MSDLFTPQLTKLRILCHGDEMNNARLIDRSTPRAILDFGERATHADSWEGEAPAGPCVSAAIVGSAGASPSQFHNRTRLHPSVPGATFAMLAALSAVWLVAMSCASSAADDVG
ncbi:MAG: hypothetical protein WCO86_15790, partial [Planctomycetota bacterium]